MKRYSFYLPLLLAVALAGCKDPTKDSVTSGSTIGNTTISDSTYTLVSGGTYTASTESDAVLFHNLTNAGILSSPTTLTTATLSSVVTTVGNVSNDGGGGHPGDW